MFHRVHSSLDFTPHVIALYCTCLSICLQWITKHSVLTGLMTFNKYWSIMKWQAGSILCWLVWSIVCYGATLQCKNNNMQACHWHICTALEFYPSNQMFSVQQSLTSHVLLFLTLASIWCLELFPVYNAVVCWNSCPDHGYCQYRYITTHLTQTLGMGVGFLFNNSGHH